MSNVNNGRVLLLLLVEFCSVPSHYSRPYPGRSGRVACVTLVCGETDCVAGLLRRLNAARGKPAAEDISVIDEDLPEIKRRR